MATHERNGYDGRGVRINRVVMMERHAEVFGENPTVERFPELNSFSQRVDQLLAHAFQEGYIAGVRDGFQQGAEAADA